MKTVSNLFGGVQLLQERSFHLSKGHQHVFNNVNFARRGLSFLGGRYFHFSKGDQHLTMPMLAPARGVPSSSQAAIDCPRSASIIPGLQTAVALLFDFDVDIENENKSIGRLSGLISPAIKINRYHESTYIARTCANLCLPTAVQSDPTITYSDRYKIQSADELRSRVVNR